MDESPSDRPFAWGLPSGSSWLPDGTPPPRETEARRRLSEALRRTIHLLMEREASVEELERAAAGAEAFADRLAESPPGHPLWGFAETATAGNPRAMFESSPLSGRSNPIAPPLMLNMAEDGGAEGTANFGIAYAGPPGHVHGGFVAAAFDEVLGMVQSMTGQPGMTGTLTVRYRRPTPLHKDVYFKGKVDRVEGRKIFTSAQLFDGENLCAEAEGIFISVGSEHFQSLAVERARAMREGQQ